MGRANFGLEATRTAVLVAGIALASGCGGGGGGSSSVPAPGNVVPGGGNTTVSSIIIPSQATVSAAAATRKAQYVTSSTNGVVVYSWSGTQPANPTPVAQGDWSSTSALCKAAAGGRTCSISFNAPVSTSNTTIVVNVYDHAPAGCGSNGFCNGGPSTGSHLISIGVQTGQTIVANGQNQVTVQTSGVLASVQIAVASGAVTATGLDADGMAIGGPCLDGGTSLAITPITGILLTASGFSLSGSAAYASSTCSAAGASAGGNSGFISATAASSRGTLSGVTGYDVVSGGNGTSGPVSVQTVTAAGGTIGFTPSNSSSNSNSNFGGGTFSFSVPPGGVSGSPTVTVAEVAPTTLSAFITASNLRRPQYTSGGSSNPNVVFYSFALAVGGGTLTSSLNVGGTLYVTNGVLADALGGSGTLYVASSSGQGATPIDVGSVAYTYYDTGAMTADPTGSCSAAGIDTSCLVLGTFTALPGKGILASGVYMLYLPAAVVVTGTACSGNGGNLCTTSTLTGNATLQVSQPGPDGTTFSLSSSTCSSIVSFPATILTNSGSLPLTTASGPLNASCQITVSSSAGGAPATVNVSVSISPTTPTLTVKFGNPTGTNYTGFAWQSSQYMVLGSQATVPITLTGTASNLTLSLGTSQAPLGHSSIAPNTFALSATSVSSLPATVNLTYTGDGKYASRASNPFVGAQVSLSIGGGSPVISLDPSSISGVFLLSGSTFTIQASCLSVADDNTGNNESSNLDIGEELTGKNATFKAGCQ
jgi:hypothetical protein